MNISPLDLLAIEIDAKGDLALNAECLWVDLYAGLASLGFQGSGWGQTGDTKIYPFQTAGEVVDPVSAQRIKINFDMVGSNADCGWCVVLTAMSTSSVGWPYTDTFATTLLKKFKATKSAPATFWERHYGSKRNEDSERILLSESNTDELKEFREIAESFAGGLSEALSS